MASPHLRTGIVVAEYFPRCTGVILELLGSPPILLLLRTVWFLTFAMRTAVTVVVVLFKF